MIQQLRTTRGGGNLANIGDERNFLEGIFSIG